MSELLLVIPFSANDGVLAEHLIDFIFLVNKRAKVGHCLLAVAGDTSPEMEAKVKIAAEVAFESVDIVKAPRVMGPEKNLHINALFKAAAEHVQKNFRLPWLWLEPDCAPVSANWMHDLTEAYFSQPKRYLGSWYKLENGSLFLARVGVYPVDAYGDLAGALTQNAKFNMTAGASIVEQSTKSYLVHDYVTVNDDSFVPRKDAVLVHGDKNGILINKQREFFEQRANKKK